MLKQPLSASAATEVPASAAALRRTAVPVGCERRDTGGSIRNSAGRSWAPASRRS